MKTDTRNSREGINVDTCNSGNGDNRRKKMKTDIGNSGNEQVQFNGNYTKTEIIDRSWDNRLLVYTEDLDLTRKLSRWESCWRCDPSQQRCIESGDHKEYVMGFSIQFPRTMRTRLERACKNCRDDEQRRISFGSWNADLDPDGGHGSLIHAIIQDLITHSDSKTVSDVIRGYGKYASEKSIRRVFRKLSQQNGPLVLHHGFKYSLRIDMERTGGKR